MPRNLDKVSQEVVRLTDRLGKPVDEKIMPLVVGLRRWGVQTTASCEGHPDKVILYPWVDVPSKQVALLARVVGWQNRPKFPDGSDNHNRWVLRPQFKGIFRLIPEDKVRPLEELQENAIEFGRFLQNLPDTWG